MKSYSMIRSILGICLLQVFPIGKNLNASHYQSLFLTSAGASIEPFFPLQAVSPLDVNPNPPLIAPPVESSSLEAKETTNSNDVSSSSLPQRAENVLDFWFGSLPRADYFPQDKSLIWLTRNPEVDRYMREKFSEDILSARQGAYNDWRNSPRGRLALILLLDQFPRHIYRAQPQKFMSDLIARSLVIEGIRQGDDQQLYPVEKAFFYLPLAHAEHKGMQALSISSYQRLVEESSPLIKLQMQDFLLYALSQQQQVSNFGRFPSRNRILKRKSTPTEASFLNQLGNSSR